MIFNQIYNKFKRVHNHTEEMKYPFHQVQTHKNQMQIISGRKKQLEVEIRTRLVKIEVKKVMVIRYLKKI